MEELMNRLKFCMALVLITSMAAVRNSDSIRS